MTRRPRQAVKACIHFFLLSYTVDGSLLCVSVRDAEPLKQRLVAVSIMQSNNRDKQCVADLMC